MANKKVHPKDKRYIRKQILCSENEIEIVGNMEMLEALNNARDSAVKAAKDKLKK